MLTVAGLFEDVRGHFEHWRVQPAQQGVFGVAQQGGGCQHIVGSVALCEGALKVAAVVDHEALFSAACFFVLKLPCKAHPRVLKAGDAVVKRHYSSSKRLSTKLRGLK